MFFNMRVSHSKNSREKTQSPLEQSAMKPSFGGQEEDPARASSHSMQKGPNSADIEIFNQELQNQINQDSVEPADGKAEAQQRPAQRPTAADQVGENNNRESAVDEPAHPQPAAGQSRSASAERPDEQQLQDGAEAQPLQDELISVHTDQLEQEAEEAAELHFQAIEQFRSVQTDQMEQAEPEQADRVPELQESADGAAAFARDPDRSTRGADDRVEPGTAD